MIEASHMEKEIKVGTIIIDALDDLNLWTGVSTLELIDILTGHCWDEEGAGTLKEIIKNLEV